MIHKTRASFNADDNRRMIEHQIESLIRRSHSLPSDHPAQKGIERTLQKLYVEAQTKD